MEEIKEKKVKSKTAAKSKSANSVKTVNEEIVKKDKKDSTINKKVQHSTKIDQNTTKTKAKTNASNKPKVEKNIKVISEKADKIEAELKDTKKSKQTESAEKAKQTEKLHKEKQLNSTKKMKIQQDTEKKATKTKRADIQKEKTDEKETEEVLETEYVEEIDIKQIEQEIEQHNKISSVESKKIKRMIIPNIVIAIILTLFYIFIELGFKNIETINYIVDLKVFSGIFLAMAIYLFEKSYKNEDSKKSIYGIEMLILSIFNFALVYIYYTLNQRFEIIVFSFSIIVVIYYIMKSIILYIKKKKEYFFEKSDIKEIISK